MTYAAGLRRSVALAALLLLKPLSAAHAAAVESLSTEPLDGTAMVMGMLGGLALFLFGMEQMSGALKALAGVRLRGVLARLTTNRVAGALTGAVVTGVIQSSSVTTVLTVGFISAGVLTLSQAVGIIFGSNIGTTLTAQIIAFQITAYALLMIAVGFGILFVGRSDTLKQYGTMLMGLGLVFYGMSVMGTAMHPLRSYAPFLDLMLRMESPLLAIAVAAAFTALVQSSSATTGIVIAMSSQGLISLPAGIALIFGANVGTCITAMLASLGKPREAIRASLVHVLFNILGVVLWVGFIDRLADWVAVLSPAHPELSGTARLAAEVPRQVANAHTVFNVANTLIFLPLAPQFARLAEWILPDRAQETQEPPSTTALTNLYPALLIMPSVAQAQVRHAIGTMAQVVRGMLAEILPAIIRGNQRAAAEMLEREQRLTAMEAEIDEYLVTLSRRNLVKEQSEENARLLYVTHELEHVGDIVKDSLVDLLRRKAAARTQFPEEANTQLLGYHALVLDGFDRAIAAFLTRDAAAAEQAVGERPDLRELERAYRQAHYDRLGRDGSEAATGSRLEVDLIDYLRRIVAYTESIARTALEDARKASGHE